MNVDPVLIVSAAALSLSLLSFVVHWRNRVSRARDRSALEAAIDFATEKQRAESLQACTALQGELKQAFDTLEQFVLAPAEPPSAGSLNRSARSQALQLLRSGMSAESAAARLGMGKREMRLLDRVSQTFCSR